MTIDPGIARTTAELRFAHTLIPCPRCRWWEVEDRWLNRSEPGVWCSQGPCALCGLDRVLTLRIAHEDMDAPICELATREPSTLISFAQFLAELARLRPMLVLDPTSIAFATDWRSASVLLRRALTCVNEALKFPAPPASLADDQQQLRAAKAAYTADAPRIWPQETYPPPARGKLDRETTRAHDTWLRAGRQGPGRMELSFYKPLFASVGNENLTGALLESVCFTGVQMTYADFDDASIVRSSFDAALLGSAHFERAQLSASSFVRSSLSTVPLTAARIETCDFSFAEAERSSWRGADVRSSHFYNTGLRDTVLDDAKFIACNFRRAGLGTGKYANRATTRGARFEYCDLRDTDWTGRDLAGATLVGCVLGGSSGAPRAAEGLRLEDCDLADAETWLEQLRAAAATR